MIYLASYKSTQRGLSGVVNVFIRWATKGQYSHSEICIGNPFDGEVDCLSSVGMDGGVRIKRMKLNPARWDLIPLPNVTEKQVLAFSIRNVGSKYDYLGCVRTLLPFIGREHPTRYFCSELCAEIIGYSEPWRLHPSALHSVLKDI